MDGSLTYQHDPFTVLKKRIINAFIIVQIVISFLVMSFGITFTPQTAELIYLRNQQISIIIYNQLLQRMNVDDVCSDPFPEYYCGAYVNDEGKLVLKVKDIEEGQRLAEGFNENLVIIETGDVSINLLNETVKDINGKYAELSDKGIDVNCAYTDILTGKVLVGVNEINGEAEEYLNKMISHPELLEFVESETQPEETALEVGDHVVSGANGAACSIGFKAKDDKGNIGYIISGHAGDFVGEHFMMNDEVTGSVTRTTYVNPSTPADAAFIRLRSGFTLSNYLSEHQKVYAAQSIEYPQHCLVDMCGSVSGWQQGRIMSNNMTFYSPVVTLTRQVLASYTSTGGDSGGPIMIKDYEEDGTSYYSVIGIHLGSVKVFKIRVGAYYTRYRYISQALSVTYWDE